MLPIYVYGHPILRKQAEEIDEQYEGLQELIEKMYKTMYKTDGVGIAAPQVGKSIQLFVIDASAMEEEYPECKGFKKVFINPEILEVTGEQHAYAEGCLSIPGMTETISRQTEIEIEYYNQDFQLVTEKITGFPAKIVQHEYDHLIGKLFVDYCSPLKKKLLKRKLTSISKGNVSTNHKYVFAK